MEVNTNASAKPRIMSASSGCDEVEAIINVVKRKPSKNIIYADLLPGTAFDPSCHPSTQDFLFVPVFDRMLFLEYKRAYQSSSGAEQRRILASYFAAFPSLAFQPGTWSWYLWKKAVIAPRSDRSSARMLKLIARAVTSPLIEKKYKRAALRLAAKAKVKAVTSNPEIREKRKAWKEAQQLNLNSEEQRRYQLDLRNTILAELKDIIPTPRPRFEGTRFFQLMRLGLRPATEFLVSKLMSIPIRDLQVQ